jgi:hypothetical protein
MKWLKKEKEFIAPSIVLQEISYRPKQGNSNRVLHTHPSSISRNIVPETNAIISKKAKVEQVYKQQYGKIPLSSYVAPYLPTDTLMKEIPSMFSSVV